MLFISQVILKAQKRHTTFWKFHVLWDTLYFTFQSCFYPLPYLFQFYFCRCNIQEALLFLENSNKHKGLGYGGGGGRRFYDRHSTVILSSQEKINNNFANSYLKTKANNTCFTVLKCTCKGLQKTSVRVVKSKPKVLRHLQSILS